MTSALGFIVLVLATLAAWILNVPLFVGAVAALMLVTAGACAAAITLVALGCRGIDKIRGV